MKLYFLLLIPLIFMTTGWNEQPAIRTIDYSLEGHGNDFDDAPKRYATEHIDFFVKNVRVRLESTRTLLFPSEKTPNRYSLKNLIDKNLKSAWVTEFHQGPNEDGEGDFKLEFSKAVFIKSFTIYNGYQRSHKIYSENQRIKTISINPVHIGGPSYPMWKTVELPDQMEPYKIDLIKLFGVNFQLLPITRLIFAVDQIYAGKKYKDICLSEVEIAFFKKSPYKPTISWKALKAEIEADITYRNQPNFGWDSSIISDDNTKYFFDLMYYAMNRNKEAQKLFITYNPMGVGASESMSNIYLPAYKAFLKDSP